MFKYLKVAQKVCQLNRMAISSFSYNISSFHKAYGIEALEKKGNKDPASAKSTKQEHKISVEWKAKFR